MSIKDFISKIFGGGSKDMGKSSDSAMSGTPMDDMSSEASHEHGGMEGGSSSEMSSDEETQNSAQM